MSQLSDRKALITVANRRVGIGVMCRDRGVRRQRNAPIVCLRLAVKIEP